MPTPRHPTATTFLRQKLFTELRNMSELEKRIARLPDEQTKGDAFEVFAEAYLATQRKHDAAEVWPLPAAPLERLQELGLTTYDYGVDGLLQTTLGQLDVYQVKYRTGRQPLAWRELSTFMGLADSPHIHSRILFTNCEELPVVMNERHGFFCIRGSDLDRLEQSDFTEIEDWLAGTPAPAKKKEPLPHQGQALGALIPALREHDRVSAIMACGTGKTLLALWIAEHVAQASSPAGSDAVPAATILVLLPSLALVRQTLHEWLHETRLPSLAYLCVCSDPTVKEEIDTISTQQSDLDFEVTTDSRSVREFLDAPFDGVKAVFSTYQSARVVAAGMERDDLSSLSCAADFPSATSARELAPVQSADKSVHSKNYVFDLGIFDEAHKTAGREGRNFAFALEDRHLPIRKRLFLTATPRHYNPLRKDKEGDAQLIFSMENPEVYGPQAYRLTFAEAARRAIICGYKVIISVITSEMVTNELLNRGEVLVHGDHVRARQVANQIALKDAIERYGVNKIFTFHSTVKSAASFTSDGCEGIGVHLRKVAADVTGLTSMTNDEGVAHNGNQNSLRSAATNPFRLFHVNGSMPTALRERYMRDFRESARGIMSNARCLTEGVDVPAVDMVAFLAPKRSRVDIVQATGRAMRRAPGKVAGYVLVPLFVEVASGETLEQAVARADFGEIWNILQAMQDQDEVLAETIRAMREQRGETAGFDDTRFRETVEVLAPLMSLDLIRRSVIAACVDTLGDTWDEHYGQLKAFKTRLGHCRVPVLYPENPELGMWVSTQRQKRKARTLSQERIAKLDAIGFMWNPTDEFWEGMFSALIEYRRSHGDCRVPFPCPEHPQLGIWVKNQRTAKQNTSLDEEHFRRLEKLGFSWNLKDEAWEQAFGRLLEFKRAYGHCSVPRGWLQDQKLATWVSAQRQAKKNGRLSEDRIRRLDAIGFGWERRASPRDQLTNQATLDDSGCADISSWLAKKWAAVWEENYNTLLQYKQDHGDCNVPRDWHENPRLSNWVTAQRPARNNGSLSEDRARRLEELGFVWDLRDLAWKQMFKELVEYRSQHGDCKVPQSYRANSRLAVWVNNQRIAKRYGRLDAGRVKLLEEIGFCWGQERKRAIESSSEKPAQSEVDQDQV